jgi:hypothetical protein
MHTLIIILALALAPLCMQAQEVTPDTVTSDTICIVEMNDGNEIVGTLLEDHVDHLVLLSGAYGKMTIDKRQISSMRLTTIDSYRGQFYNPQSSTRYFWGPSGHGLRAGEGYYQNVWILFNQVSLGITDNVSVGLGLVPTFLFGVGSIPIWIAPKASVPLGNDAGAIGGGMLIGTVSGEGGSFGVAYGALTLGGRENNVSFSLGYGLIDGEWAELPTMSFSAMARVSSRTSFITENYYIPADEGVGIISLGFRTAFSGISLDYGLVIPVIQGSGTFALPWLGISVPFGHER